MKKFLDCISVVGATPSRFQGTKKYVSTGAVATTEIDESEVVEVTYEDRPSRANLSAEAGDILFAKMQGTRKTLLLDTETEENIYSTGFYAVRANPEVITTECLYYLVDSELFLTQKDKHCSGATQKAITNGGLAKIEIRVPPLSEQGVMAEKLRYLTQLIADKRKQLELYDQVIKSRFIEMFGDQRTNPFGWDMVTIGDIATDVRYGTSRPAVEGGKYPYLRMNNLTYEGYLDLTDLKYIDLPDNEIEKCVVRKGDVLFNRTNSVELVGKTCVYNLDYDMIIAGYIIRVRIDDRMLPVVLSNYLNSTVLKEQLRSMAKGAVNQANINAQELQSIPIYLPPIDLQYEFVAFVEQIDKSKFEIQQSLEKLEILKKSLMQQYFG